MKRTVIVLIGAFLLSSCIREELPNTGTLKGDVKYTGASSMELDNVIITLRGTDKGTKTISKRISNTGAFCFDLPVGIYLLELNGNRCKSDNLPDTVKIDAGDVQIRDINIEQLPNSMVILYNDKEFYSGDTITLGAGMAFDIWNKYSNKDLEWNIRAYPLPSWIIFENTSGIVKSGGRKSVVFSIDKIKMSNYGINYSDVILTSVDEGSFTIKVSAFKDYVSNDEFEILLSNGIMVQKKDISSGANWSSANQMCITSSLAGFNDWRLPTIGELGILYQNRGTIGGFAANDYWSSTSCSLNDFNVFWFIDGTTDCYQKNNNSIRARCVRTLP